jgi:2-polyprenyl-6-methoxyphenol hydroxylase-like FAD-dependent oxidoreductase
MQIAIIGSGPTGLMLGSALARRGHEVVSVDRDPGPAADGTWHRKGVMQFEHAHGFRGQVSDHLAVEWPEALAAWADLGAEPVLMDVPGVGPVRVGTRSRRSTFERALRIAAAGVPGLTLRVGHVDALLEEPGATTARVRGILVGGEPVLADLVVDASGRSGRLVADPAVEGDCGIAYVDRTYQLLPGADPGPMAMPIGWFGVFDGYQTLLFLHERGHFSVLFVRPTADPDLKDLRHEEVFEAAARAVPGLAEWTDPARSRPTSPVLVGGSLRNVFRPQKGRAGLVAVGDAVTTTTPTAGRGIAMVAMQLDGLLGLADGGADLATIADPFGRWCEDHLRIWVDDHVLSNDEAVRRWQGADLDLDAPLTSSAILDAAQVDPRIQEYAGPFGGMQIDLDALRAAEPMARAVYESGWRAPYSPGPTRDELVSVIRGALQPA